MKIKTYLALALSSAAVSLQAQTVFQTPGLADDIFLIRSTDATITAGTGDPSHDWTLEADANAFSGFSLVSSGPAPVADPATAGSASFSLQFATEANYIAYLRVVAPSSGGNSFFAPAAFDTAPTVNTAFPSDAGFGPDFAWLAIDLAASGAGVVQGTTGGISYTIGAAAIGTPLDFTVDVRESGGFRIDSIVFSSNTALSATQLDTIAAVPEPASAGALIGAAAIALCFFSRRRRA